MSDYYFSVAETVTVLRNLQGRPYEDEAVDQLEHALQTAGQARAAHADNEVVVAALLHDIGRAPEVIAVLGNRPHEETGAEFCRHHCGDRVGYLVGQHVPAKRYLVAVDEVYANGLSPASQRSLERQGGPMTAAEVTDFLSHPWALEAAQLRRWDDGAKSEDADTDSLESYLPLLRDVWRHVWRHVDVTTDE